MTDITWVINKTNQIVTIVFDDDDGERIDLTLTWTEFMNAAPRIYGEIMDVLEIVKEDPEP